MCMALFCNRYFYLINIEKSDLAEMLIACAAINGTSFYISLCDQSIMLANRNTAE